MVDVHVPPPRERVADVGELMDQLLVRVASRMGRRIRGYMDVARPLLTDYARPESVRELELAVERACTVAQQPLINAGDLRGRAPTFILDASAPARGMAQPPRRGP